LYLTHDVATTNIKMVVTIQVGKIFYVPLGIYRSPIADVYDKGPAEIRTQIKTKTPNKFV